MTPSSVGGQTVLSFSEFCASLGCPLKNMRWSWSALSPAQDRAVFTIWSDELRKGRYVLYPTTGRRPGEIDEEANARQGALEIQRIAMLVADNPKIEALGILCRAEDQAAVPRERRTFDRDTVFRLRIQREGEQLIAYTIDRPKVSTLRQRA
jgi:hypothetical protein